jgi:hypothetical protein
MGKINRNKGLILYLFINYLYTILLVPKLKDGDQFFGFVWIIINLPVSIISTLIINLNYRLSNFLTYYSIPILNTVFIYLILSLKRKLFHSKRDSQRSSQEL